jgi:hypothetical protein
MKRYTQSFIDEFRIKKGRDMMNNVEKYGMIT